MKKVVLRAPVLTQSGYGVHSRQVARWLIGLAEANHIDLTIQCVPWGDTTWFTNADALDGLVGKLFKYSGADVPAADVSFQVILPNEWENIAKYNVGITAGIETDRCHPGWISAVNNMSEVIVPSEHTKKCFTNTGRIQKDITVIPESFPDALAQDPQEDKFNFDTDFNLLVFGQLTAMNFKDDRKNIFNTLKVLINTFKDKDDVGIILKSNVGRSTILDFKQIQGVLTEALTAIGHKGSPKVYLLHGNMADDDLRDLYKNPKVKGLVTMTRGEGFGLPILEAAACGVPVVATKWSAHTDYMKKDSYLDIKYDLVEISDQRADGNLFIKGMKWAEASEKSATEALEKLYKYYSIYDKRAKKHQESILESHSFESIKNQYQEHFYKILC